MTPIYQRGLRLLRRCRENRLFQALLILMFWLVGETLVRVTGLALPGAVVGMFLLLALLASKRLHIRTVRRGARWYLAEMLLFFIPAVPAVLDHPEFLGLLGLKILVVIVVGSLMIMIVTAAVIDLCYRFSSTERVCVDASK
jgi:holin-like protein